MGETCLLSSLSYFKTLWRYRKQIVKQMKFLVDYNYFPIYMDLLCIFFLVLFLSGM